VNEGAAKALRRRARAAGIQSTAPGRGTVIPGKESKALWSSLSHKQRGEWRSKLPATRAANKRAIRARMRLEASFAWQCANYPVNVGDDTFSVLDTGRISYTGSKSLPPRSR
jgi:hypothetical protein